MSDTHRPSTVTLAMHACVSRVASYASIHGNAMHIIRHHGTSIIDMPFESMQCKFRTSAVQPVAYILGLAPLAIAKIVPPIIAGQL